MADGADILFINAALWGGVDQPGWLAVKGNRILSVGVGDPPSPSVPHARVVDARRASLLPGLNDAHVHLFPGGMALYDLCLSGVRGEVALRRSVEGYRAARPDLRFLSAYGAPYDLLAAGNTPDRAALDGICGDIPLLIMAEDFHTAWANSAALALAGIDRGADLPQGSQVVLDATGYATGELLEFGAIDLVRRCNPASARHSAAAQAPLTSLPVSPAERAADKAVLRAALRHCAGLGLTAVQNMDGSLYQLELLAEMERDEGLPVRVRMPFHVQPGQGPADFDHAVHWRATHASDHLRCDFVKIFADGVVESGTAHMLADYSHTPGQRGATLIPDEHLQSLVARADRLGFQIAVHCVGDAAVRQVLDAYAAARAANGPRDARHRIEHVEVIDPADIPRFAELGVVASMQPCHVPDGGEGYLDLIGPVRGRYAFAQADLRAAGVRVVLSTDWPIVPLEPMISVQAALARPDWGCGGPDQRIDLATALEGITSAAAWVAFDEDCRGTLRPGALADLTLMDRDLRSMAPEDLAIVGVRLTLCDGQPTHDPERLLAALPQTEEV